MFVVGELTIVQSVNPSPGVNEPEIMNFIRWIFD